MLKRTVESLFSIRRKAASRKLPALQVVIDARTANTLSRATVIGAGAFFEIFFLLAVHHQCAAAS
jgi:preprotein translocase subunit SecG